MLIGCSLLVERQNGWELHPDLPTFGQTVELGVVGRAPFPHFLSASY